MTANEKMYFSVKDIQTLLGCGKNKAYAVIKQPDFPQMKIGKSYYIPQEEFFKWQQRQMRKSTGYKA